MRTFSRNMCVTLKFKKEKSLATCLEAQGRAGLGTHGRLVAGVRLCGVVSG